MAAEVTVIDHPLIQHKLSGMRNKDTPPADFRRLLREITLLMTYEVTRDLPLGSETLETPLARIEAPCLAGRDVVLASILRAGQGMVEPMLEVLPSARVGHVGLYREPTTLEAVEYYFKMPADMPERQVIALDPMLATGHSSAAALTRIKEVHPKSIKMVCLLAAPEGITHLAAHHPDVSIFTAAIDERLNDHGYIVPGLGDAGDRIYGT